MHAEVKEQAMSNFEIDISNGYHMMPTKQYFYTKGNETEFSRIIFKLLE